MDTKVNTTKTTTPTTSTTTQANTGAVKKTVYRTTVALSIRRKPAVSGLPGQDMTITKQKVGASIGIRPLTFEEEEQYLPELINISANDVEFRKGCKEYWNNISEPVPSDGVNANLVATSSTVYGKPLEFTVQFTTQAAQKALEAAADFAEKVKIIQKHKGIVIDGVADYVLFRHCLVYSKVANNLKDIGKSAKIKFYLYSKQAEVNAKYSKLQLERKAAKMFEQVIDNEQLVDALLIRFKFPIENYPTIEDKHLALHKLCSTKSKEFVMYASDDKIQEKALILRAASFNIIHNPPNTEAYYFGDNNEVLLGKTLMDTVLYFRSKVDRNVQIKDTVVARLKEFDTKK